MARVQSPVREQILQAMQHALPHQKKQRKEVQDLSPRAPEPAFPQDPRRPKVFQWQLSAPSCGYAYTYLSQPPIIEHGGGFQVVTS